MSQGTCNNIAEGTHKMSHPDPVIALSTLRPPYSRLAENISGSFFLQRVHTTADVIFHNKWHRNVSPWMSIKK